MPIIKNRMFLWRVVSDFWTLFAFAVIIEDYRQNGALEYLVGPVMAIYVVVLAIFSAEKEFERWYMYNIGRHIGEIYVYAWTLLIAGLFVATYLTHSDYKMSPEIFSTYIVVLGVLAVTRKSKEIFKEKKGVLK
jgi:hypothetical protein